MALLIYDYLLNVNKEVTLMWPMRFGFVKILFFLTRYMPFVDVTLVLYYQLKENITAQTCERLYTSAGWMIVIGISIAEAILVVRTWAIWGQGKRMACILAAVFVVCLTPVLVIEHIFLQSVAFSPHPGRATPGCLLSGGSSIIAVSFAIVILFETFVLILTLIKGVQHYRWGGYRGVVAVFYRDGVLFYLYLLGMSVINLIVIVAAPRDLADMLAILQRVLHSCLSARVLLNLREAGRREVNPSFNSLPLRVIRFASTTMNTSTSTDTPNTTTASGSLPGPDGALPASSSLQSKLEEHEVTSASSSVIVI
ncbi:hypothetical protein BDW22DRAFT_1429098 [Trametopsis cervina]|nr:hypothetical protein BDW22DRAFT_1429098 [Trametopsis cervina]